MDNKKNILLVGNNISAITLAKKIVSQGKVENLYVVGMPVCEPCGFEFVDIREDNVSELLNFALEHAIDLTIVVSTKALKADIPGVFSANGQMVFAPEFDCAKHFLDCALTKKFLYKLKIPTSKFGVFEKQQLALDYLKTANYPIVIKSANIENERDLFACPTVSVAKIAVNDLFFKAVDKVVIEEFVNGHNFNFYIVTDGYKALPLGTVTSHLFSDDVNGGFLTLGSAALNPDVKVSHEINNKLMKDVINRILSSLESCGTSYVGVLGLNCVLQDEKVYIQSISTFFSDVDASVILNTIDEDLISLFTACAMGVFADDYDEINVNDNSSVALSLFSRNDGEIIKGLDLIDSPENLVLSTSFKNDNYYSQKGYVGVVSSTASTLSRAKSNLAEEIKLISFNGLKYRKDIIQ